MTTETTATKTIRITLLALALVGLLVACQPGSPPTSQETGFLPWKPGFWMETRNQVFKAKTWFLNAVPNARIERSFTDRACVTAPQAGELPGREGRGCSVFTVAKGDRVFFGGNDDYIDPDSYYWVEPGKGDDYGVVWIGTPDNVQQGVNEMGLAYDANGLPEVEMNPHRERTPWPGHMGSAQMHILHECATVEEVIEWVQTHQVWPRMNDQRQFADASGDAVLIGPGPDGELVFTRKPRGDGFLVSTNFNVADPEHNYGGVPCSRYETAQAMLGDLVEGSGALAVEDAAGVLDAIHQESGTSWTISSLVADLPNGLIYLYYFYQFDKPVVLNVADELAHARAPGPLSALFSDDVRREAARRYARIQNQGRRCRWIGMAWIVAALLCFVLLVVLSPGGTERRPEPAGMHFWLLLVLVLGPLGFLVWLLVGRNRRPPPQPSPADPRPSAGEGEEVPTREGDPVFFPPGPASDYSRQGTEGGRWRVILLEAAGDVMPVAVALALHLALAVKVPAALGGGLLPLVLIVSLPLAVSWLLFQGPLLALEAKRGYLCTLWRRLPHALVSANLGMAGLLPLALPLAAYSPNICSYLPSPGWSLGFLWASVALGALPGGLLLACYHGWAVRRGLAAWRAVGWNDVPVDSARWRQLWGWVLLSYGALLGGVIAATVVLQRLSVQGG